MRKIYKTLGILSMVLGITIFQFSNSYTNTSGPPSGKSGAPGDATCQQSGCHSTYSLNSGSNRSDINISTTMIGGEYAQDSTYQVTVSFDPPSISRAGFEITALGNFTAGSSSVGNFTSTSSNTQTIMGSGREYVAHTSSGSAVTGNSVNWTFDWKAPSSNQGDVRFYLALNEANNDGFNSNDYIYTKTLTVQHHPAPTPSIKASNTTVCVGDTVSFQGSATGNPTDWEWTFPSGNPSQSTNQNEKVVFTKAGKHNVTLVASDNIATSKAATKTITVKGEPKASISPVGKDTLCYNDTLTVNASSPNGNTFKWSNGASGSSIQIQDEGSYYVTALNSPCPADTSDTLSVDKYERPTLSLAIDKQQDTLCTNDTLLFTAKPGFTQYEFINLNTSKTLAKSGSDSFTLNKPQDNLQVFVRATDTNGCIAYSDTIKKQIDTIPAPPQITCSNSTTNSVTFSWNPVSKATSYEVSLDTGKTWNSQNATSYQATGLDFEEKVEIRVRAVNSNSVCSLSNVAVKVCESDPCANIGFTLNRDSVICPSDSSEFQFSNLSTSNYGISFDGDAYKQQQSFTYRSNSTDTVTVKIIDSNQLNCPPRVFEYPVKVLAPTQVTLTPDRQNAEYCKSDTVTISGDEPSGNYDFYLNNNKATTNADSTFSFSDFKDEDSVFAVVTDTNGCIDTTNTITINPLPSPSVKLNTNDSNNTFCQGDTVAITGSLANGMYDYFRNGTAYLTDTNETIRSTNFSDQDSLFAIVKDNNQCIDTTPMIGLTINDLPDVGFTYTPNDLTVDFEDTTNGNIQTRQWQLGDNTTKQQAILTHTYDTGGQYEVTLRVTNSNDCESAITKPITVKDATFIPDSEAPINVKVFPNPVKHQLRVKINRLLKKPRKLSIKDLSGQTVKRIKLTPSIQEFNVNLQSLSEGSYLLSIDGQRLTQFIKQ